MIKQKTHTRKRKKQRNKRKKKRKMETKITTKKIHKTQQIQKETIQKYKKKNAKGTVKHVNAYKTVLLLGVVTHRKGKKNT